MHDLLADPQHALPASHLIASCLAAKCSGCEDTSSEDACAVQDSSQTNRRLTYDGAVLNTVMAMTDLAHGGQILMDEASYNNIKSELVQLRSVVPPGASLSILQAQCRQETGFHMQKAPCLTPVFHITHGYNLQVQKGTQVSQLEGPTVLL